MDQVNTNITAQTQTQTQSQSSVQPQQRSKPRSPIRVTSSTGHSYGPPTNTMLAQAFSTDPVFAYLLHHLPLPSRLLAREKMFRIISSLLTIDSAIFYESSSASPINSNTDNGVEAGKNDAAAAAAAAATAATPSPQFQCCAIIARPGQQTDPASPSAWWTLLRRGIISVIWTVGLTNLPRLFSYGELVTPVKEKYFSQHGNAAYYEVKFIGTDAAHRGKGLCPAIIKEVQVQAEKEGKPIWLEASNKNARGVYKKCGFEDVGSPLVLGNGIVNIEGEKTSGKEASGVEIWPMVWWPDGVSNRK